MSHAPQSQSPAGFEWTIGIVIGIACSAIALIALPTAVYLMIRWRDLERKRVESSEGGLSRRNEWKVGRAQSCKAEGVSRGGMVDLAMWSPVSARRDGFVVLPELAYYPGEKMRTSVMNLPGTGAKVFSGNRTHNKTPSSTSIGLGRPHPLGRRPSPDPCPSSTATYVQPGDLLFTKEADTQASAVQCNPLQSVEQPGRLRRNAPARLIIHPYEPSKRAPAPAVASSTCIADSDDVDSARTTATITAAWTMKDSRASPSTIAAPIRRHDHPPGERHNDMTARTSRSSSLSTALCTATSLTHSGGVSRRTHADDMAEMEEVSVVSAYSARKSVAIFSSLSSAPSVPSGTPVWTAVTVAAAYR